MIDEKKLQELFDFTTKNPITEDEAREVLRLALVGVAYENYASTAEKVGNLLKDKKYFSETSKLMRLGLWAKEHGVPALQQLHGYGWASSLCIKALDALPRD